METNTKSNGTVPGTEPEEETIAQISDYIKKDCAMLIAFLHTIMDDPTIRDLMASHYKGRMDNIRNAVKNQKKLFDDPQMEDIKREMFSPSPVPESKN